MTYKISEQEGEFIRKYFPTFGVDYCRKKLNKTTSQIEAYCLKYKIKSNRDYNCNINDYINIFTPEIIYTLGFLWADGSITKMSKKSYFISVTVTKKDEIYLKRVLNKWPFKWKVYNRPAKSRIYKGVLIKGKPSTNFYLSDRYISTFLVNKDYLIKSGASADKILEFIPNDLKHYWWRGYFDGDGSFYCNQGTKVQFSSVENQNWKFVIDLCDFLDIYYVIRKYKNKLGSSSTLTIVRHDDCIKILDYIYKDRQNDKIGYTRKYKKFKNARLKPLEKTSIYRGVCLDKSKSVNPWVCYYKGKYIGCADTPEKALELREEYIKNYGVI